MKWQPTPVFLPGRGAWWATVHGVAVVPKWGCNWPHSLGIWECGGLDTKMTGVGSEMQMFWHEWGGSAQWGGSCLVGHHVSTEGWGQREARGLVSIAAHCYCDVRSLFPWALEAEDMGVRPALLLAQPASSPSLSGYLPPAGNASLLNHRRCGYSWKCLLIRGGRVTIKLMKLGLQGSSLAQNPLCPGS